MNWKKAVWKGCLGYESNYVKVLVAQSCLALVTPWTVALQAPLSMEFSSQESWSGLPFPTPGNLPDPGIKPTSLALASRFITTKPPWKHISKKYLTKNIIFFLIAIINQCTRHFSCLWDFWILVYTIPLQLYSSRHQCPYTQIAQHSGL